MGFNVLLFAFFSFFSNFFLFSCFVFEMPRERHGTCSTFLTSAWPIHHEVRDNVVHDT